MRVVITNNVMALFRWAAQRNSNILVLVGEQQLRHMTFSQMREEQAKFRNGNKGIISVQKEAAKRRAIDSVTSSHIPAAARSNNVRGLRLTDGKSYPVKVYYRDS